MEERKITLVDDDQTLEFYVVEETKLNGANYLLVTDAEEQGKTLMECYPESEMATEYRILAEQILNLCREDGLC